VLLVEIIRLGNIENRDFGKIIPELYLGSGDMGASFDRFGTTDAAPRIGDLCTAICMQRIPGTAASSVIGSKRWGKTRYFSKQMPEYMQSQKTAGVI